MRHVTDIPDWVDYQSFDLLDTFDYGATTSDEQLVKMRKMSPISKASLVKSPTLMMIGWKDLRVPPPQGVEWVRALRKNGVECLQLDYQEDCHPLNQTETQADVFVQIHSWFSKHKNLK